MANVVIRTYKSADLDRCRSLWAQMTQHHRDIYDDPTIGGDEPGLEFDGHLDRVGPERVWVATVEGEVVGLTSLIQNDQEGEIEPVIVATTRRGQGIGRKLVEHATDQARKLGVLCLGVKPVARNEEAIAFFHQCGFTNLGHIQLFMWLGPPIPGQWRPGPELFGMQFSY